MSCFSLAEKSSFLRENIDNSLAILSIFKQKSEIFISGKIQPELFRGSLGLAQAMAWLISNPAIMFW